MAAESGVKPAILAKVYRNSASGGTKYASPTWTAIDMVRDASIAKPWDLVEASVRASRVKMYHPTQMDIPVSLTVRCDNADTGYLALAGAADEGTTLDILIVDGAVTVEGSRGARAHFHVSDTGQDQSIGAVLYKTFELKPGFGADDNGAPVYPKYAVVGASSAVTFSDPG
jgi:hypothetical protein